MTFGKIIFVARPIFLLAAVLLFPSAGWAGDHAPEHAPEHAASHAEPSQVEAAKTEMSKPLTEITALIVSTNLPSATNGLSSDSTNDINSFIPPTKLDQLNYTLSLARFSATTRDFPAAEKSYERLLASDAPDEMQRTALFEMAVAVQAEGDLPRAQSMFAQYLQRWVGDSRAPEVFLHQGQVFRQMGLPNFALSKFYGVMTTALSLKNDQMPYYKRLVLQAQMEIAETHLQIGRYKDAADYYQRLLTQSDPALDRAQIQFRLVRSLSAAHQHDAAARQANDFLEHYKDSRDEPEVRYYLAQALKGQGRNPDALRQVLLFLQGQSVQAKDRPEVWSYWQQRVGNEIGNQLYQDGDFIRALEVYLALSKLDGSPTWQLPVRYQVGITYEKLMQPQLAAEAYRSIAATVPKLGTNVLSPGLKSVVDMAQWRLNFLQWQERADRFKAPPEKNASNSPVNLSHNEIP